MSTSATDVDDDLEALFDRIAAERGPAAAPAPASATATSPAAAASPAGVPSPDPSAAPPDVHVAAPHDGADEAGENLFRRVGQVTRTLHEALRELGFDRTLANAASTMPDARKRLDYVASLTGRSAGVVLEGVERTQALQRELDERAQALRARWDALYAGTLSTTDFRTLAAETRAFLERVHASTSDTQLHLHEMMMAQDFHDLTGQVIKKIVDIAHTVERSLVDLLLETKPAPEAAPAGLLNGPAVGPDASGETVTSQAQVDQLLQSLGF